ncbi:hypothetical protein GGS24DRAFT_509190 [Hypoxylon argillaceum]|nr:hypothetical protein GGS24DRAFT_509190 [Hypoxylon argillaceum]
MESPFLQREGDIYHLPSTFSPWGSDLPATSIDTDSRSIRSEDLTRYGAECVVSPVSPDSAWWVENRETSSFSPERRASPVAVSPQSLDMAPPSTGRGPTAPRAYVAPQASMSSSRSIRSVSTVENVGDLRRQFSLASNISISSSAYSTDETVVPPSNSDVRRSTVIMPTHPEAQSVPLSAMYSPSPSPRRIGSEDESDVNNVFPPCAPVHLGCHSRRDVYINRWSWLYVTLVILSIYSTVLSGIWFVVSIIQPQYGRSISSGSGWQVSPSTATLLSTLIAKTIELSFVTVFVAVLGQVLTRRAFSRFSRGVTLAEMTMRNWVIQPGSLLTHWEGIPHAATTILGALTLIAAICSLFYTTASDAMVSPKLTYQDWVMRDLQGLVHASYSNPEYVKGACQTPLGDIDANNSAESCVNVLFSGQSYSSLVAFMKEWDDIHKMESPNTLQLSDRPTGTHNLFDNTTMNSSWIEKENGDMEANFATYHRVINNVTLAMPHPGVYMAATDPINGILQPSELLGLGQYSIRASVVAPVVNVMCVNMNESEVAPLVYQRWPNARTNNNSFTNDLPPDWEVDVPGASETEWLNSTVVDDIFKWGEKYGREPPVFPLFPIDYNVVTNVVTNASFRYVDALYILAKAPYIPDYTLCQMRSWESTNCTTAFDLSGTSGGYMKAECEAPLDADAYKPVAPPPGADTPLHVSGDWRNIAVQWSLAIDLDGGAQSNNASNARVLTNLIPAAPALDPHLPSVAEALAVLVANTLVTGALDTTFAPEWPHGDSMQLPKGVYESFRARVRTQQYASAHTAAWQAIFYPVLGLTFLLDLLCLGYLLSGSALTAFATGKAPPTSSSSAQLSSKQKHQSSSTARFSFPYSTHDPVKASAADSDSEDSDAPAKPHHDGSGGDGMRRRVTHGGKAARFLVTDYTEPQNLFALAVNSPPSRALAGCCGHGPDAAELGVPWRVGYAVGANHYYFEEDPRAGGRRGRGRDSRADLLAEGGGGRYAKSYESLSSRRTWL